MKRVRYHYSGFVRPETLKMIRGFKQAEKETGIRADSAMGAW